MELRLLNLLLVLQRNPAGLTSQEIYERVEQYSSMAPIVFRRNLIRDIYSLETQGIEILRNPREDTERGKIYQLS
ncbi:MAG: hypothetical protein LBC43_01515 [Bifidobacteriaceae bacterium]|jgi:predicted DNA-binding transcriptional regulator YafY|nr:hypothetical protein [Bifidobacteriaceae bacterium]